MAILGYGREGKAVLEFLKKSPKYDFAEIWVLDKNKPPPLAKGERRRVRVRSGKNYLKGLEKFDFIFRSPGVPYNLPEIQLAIKKGVIFSSATKLFFENCHCRIIGVTGTKGKGTTSTLIYEILKNAGLDVYLAGNIGQPALEILPQLKKHSIVVLELSSFQLQDMTISPQVAVVLDVFPDHLDAHKNFKEYLEAKANIAKYQIRDNKVFYFRGNKFSAQVARYGFGKKISVAASTKLFKPEELKIPGEHNFKNAVMAVAVAKEMDCEPDVIRETILNFRGLEHRLEFVRTLTQTLSLGEGRGTQSEESIAFYNDSASTNPQTTIAAIQSFKNPIILIAGGHDKGLDYAPLGKVIRKTSVKLVVLFGANKEKIKKSLKRFPTVLCNDLNSAVRAAVKSVPLIHNSKFIILFSPGSASFDMFKDYADRGEQFKKIVSSL